MKNLKAGFAIAVLIACAILLFLQHQAQEKLRAENESLTQQLAQLKTDNESLSNLAARAKNSQPLPDDQLNELLRLRGEVGVLRRQVVELGKLQEENRQIRAGLDVAQAPKTQLSTTAPDQVEQHRIDTVNALKQLGLAMRIYAGDHEERYATNFDQLISGGEILTTNFNGGVTVSDFEFMNVGLVNDTMPDKIIFRERIPRQTPDGKWQRVYGMADGSVWTQTSADGNFDAYEKQHMISPPPNQ
jgi:hypothetical protein